MPFLGAGDLMYVEERWVAPAGGYPSVMSNCKIKAPMYLQSVFPRVYLLYHTRNVQLVELGWSFCAVVKAYILKCVNNDRAMLNVKKSKYDF